MKEYTYIPLLLDAWKGNSAPLQKEELFQISHRVRQISRGLTGTRELAGSPYLDDPISLGAYLCYYWPISYRAASFILSSILFPSQKIDTALDVGSGAGPVTFALVDHGVKHVIACDRSQKALSILKRMAHRRHASIRTQVLDLEDHLPIPTGPFQLITLGNVLNELWKHVPDRIQRRFLFVKSLLSSLDPEGRIVILEPALSSTSMELLQVRDLITSDGTIYVEAPCFRQAHCPALPEGTCHMEIPWDPPRLVREIGRRARVTDRKSVKISYLILRASQTMPSSGNSIGNLAPFASPPSAVPCASSCPTPPTSPEGLPHRVVSDPLTAKSGRVRYLLCGPLGRFALSAPRAKVKFPSIQEVPSHRSPEGPFKVFFSLKRGDVVVFQNVEKRETGYGIREDSVLRILTRVSGPG